MTQTRQILFAARPTGEPGPEHFNLVSATLPAPGPGQVLLRVIWLSLDPYMRGRMNAAKSYTPPYEIGQPLTAGAVAEVLVSNFDGLVPGDLVVGSMAWAEHAIANGKDLQKIARDAAPLSAWLGVLGMPGMTAWTGLHRIAHAKPGETAVISAATGAVGSLAAQLAKRHGMRVIGVAGGPEKCARAVADYGCDVCLDHRAAPDAATLSAQIAAAAPNGVDVYFENVAGKTLEAVLPQMNTFGRIALCGMIAWFHGIGDAPPILPPVWRKLLTSRMKVEGFIVFDHWAHYPEFLAEVAPLVQSGAVRWQETVANGLDAAPGAFIDLLRGAKDGKQVVRIGADPA